MADEAASSGLFAVFLISIYSMFLLPYTIYYFCSAGEDATTQPVAKKGKKGSGFAEKIKALATKSNLVLLGLWVLWFAVLSYSQASMASQKPFDPFEILGVARDASERDIKKAYRKLSLVYHPDKNPDPKAAQYFASFISKAYAALTDEVSRQNYEKYGHPDGPQGMNLGVALPEWMFARDKKAAPLMLLGLVGLGILLPLGLMSWYMLSSSKFSGPNQIHNDTFLIFLHSKYNIKESQSLVRIPETLLCAMEFISLYTPPDHNGPLEELRKLVSPAYMELMSRSNKTFWQRKASVVKAHMLLLAQLERLGDEVPQQLQADLRYVRTKAPQLLEEMVKIACLPRPPAGYGWMTPALACIEMMQCIAQGLPISVRKGGGKMGDSLAPLLQLPGLDQEVLKKLRKRKINSLADLQALPEGTRATELTWAGLDASSVEGVQLFLSAMPRLLLAARCEVDEEGDVVMEGDPVHCRVRVLLSRPSHAAEGFRLRGSGVRAYTPANPVPRDESWYFLLTEPSTNSVLAWNKVNLMEAEKEGLAHPEAFAATTSSTTSNSVPALPVPANSSTNSAKGKNAAAEGAAAAANGSTGTLAAAAAAAAGDSGKKGSSRGGAAAAAAAAGGDDEVPGQEVDLVFVAPKAATLSLTLIVMSDCWVGADEALQLKLRVQPLTRAVAEGRDLALNKATNRRLAAPDSSDSEAEDGGSDGSGSSSGSGSDDEDDYDSEETGEEESGDASDDGSSSGSD